MNEVRERATTRSGLRRPPVLRNPGEENRASTWLELFFDLCFVVAVASLARGLHDTPKLGGVPALTPLVGLVALAMVGLTAFEVWHSRIPGRAVEPTTVPHQREQREP